MAPHEATDDSPAHRMRPVQHLRVQQGVHYHMAHANVERLGQGAHARLTGYDPIGDSVAGEVKAFVWNRGALVAAGDGI